MAWNEVNIPADARQHIARSIKGIWDLVAILLFCRFQYDKSGWTGRSSASHKGFPSWEWVCRKPRSGSSCKWKKIKDVNQKKQVQLKHLQTAGNWALLNIQRGSDEMRQEERHLGDQGINLGGLIGGYACFKGPCCTHLPSLLECASSLGWMTDLLGVNSPEHATGY